MCKAEGCNRPPVGNSAYCREHKREVYERWVAMVKKDRAEREALNERFRELFSRAGKAGMLAGDGTDITPMVVEQHADLLDDSSPVVWSQVSRAGVVGFAWIIITPGNCKAANYAKAKLGWQKAYGGGVMRWVSAHDQSIEAKINHAKAYVNVLRDGLKELDPRARVTFSYRED